MPDLQARGRGVRFLLGRAVPRSVMLALSRVWTPERSGRCRQLAPCLG
jgi:hypothetical protein